jgi:hypothetical protein
VVAEVAEVAPGVGAGAVVEAEVAAEVAAGPVAAEAAGAHRKTGT